MVRLFIILSVIAAITNILVGTGSYLISKTWVSAAKKHEASIAANSVAVSVSTQIKLLDETLAKMAQDPEVLEAVMSKDPIVIAATMSKLEKHFPQALKLRLLPSGVVELNDNSVPRMGFADIEMVRESFAKEHPPEIQGETEADRHLAITQRVIQNKQVIAVILASLNYDFIPKSIQTVVGNTGYLELVQDKLVLSFAGTKVNTEDADSVSAKVPNSSWEIRYYYPSDESLGDIAVIITIISIPTLFTLLCFSAGHRRVSGYLSEDIRCVMKAFKDMMTTQKLHGGYPVHLDEMNGVIPTLLQFKRVLDTEAFAAAEEEKEKPPGMSELEIDSFFDDF